MKPDEMQNLSPRRTLVISGVGMTEGGILSVLRNVVDAAERVLGEDWRIVVLVHKKSLLNSSRAELKEFPKIKASWIKRLWFEWVKSRSISRQLNSTVWFALHDITPIVVSEKQYVYCHNPTCFVRPTLKSLYFDWIFVAHSLMYGALYSIGIKRNRDVFVQQDWIKNVFLTKFGAENVIISRPSPNFISNSDVWDDARALKKWLYPTFPRHFKNIEILGEALELLAERVMWDGEILVTISGDENRYARWLKRRFGHLKNLKFIGRQSRSEVDALYGVVDGVIFPSILETWGLPITEAQSHRLPLLVSDLPYAHETVGTYNKVLFFDPFDHVSLSNLLLGLENGSVALKASVKKSSNELESHTIVGWESLIAHITRV
jgi:glycosyltransferase involved in cell wall biosynthesis